jgi:hypothetical protein
VELFFSNSPIDLQEVDLAIGEEKDAAIVGLTADSAAKDQHRIVQAQHRFDAKFDPAQSRQYQGVMLRFGNGLKQFEPVGVLHDISK